MTVRKLISLLLAIFTVLTGFSQNTNSSVQETNSKYHLDQCYIQLKEGESLGVPDGNGYYSRVSSYAELNLLMASGVVSSMDTPFKILAKMDDELDRVYTLKFSDPDALEPTLRKLNTLDYIKLAEKIPVYEHFLTPNDPLYANSSNRWHLDSIDAELGWNISTGCSNVVVAIVDDAVLTSHEDLASKIVVNAGEIPGNGIDDDNNGYIDDVNGYDVADDDNDPDPPSTASNTFFTHGTHVAGIAGAASDNGIGIASLGFNSMLLPVKVKSNSNLTSGGLDNPMEGVEYAIAFGADVINMSWGSYASSAVHQLVFNLAYSNGITCVAAVGNDGLSFLAYPANYNHVISVGATGTDNDFAPFTNFSEDLDVWAPGVNIFSTLAGGSSEYGMFSGTSMSSPIVAGLAALMICNNPALDPDDVVGCMRNSATFLPTVHNPVYQLAFINPAQSLGCTPPSTLQCEPTGCEMVANGDFEMPHFSNLSEYPYWSSIYDGDVCSWQSYGYGGTADVFPLKIDSVDNYGNFLYDGPNSYFEGIVSNVLGLVPGREYIIEFDYASTGPTFGNQTATLDSIEIGLIDNGYTHMPFTQPPTYDNLGAVYNPVVDFNWSAVQDLIDSSTYYAPNYYHHFSMTFTAGPNVVNRGRLIFTPRCTNPNIRREVQLDNISVRPVIEVDAMATNTSIMYGDCIDVSASGSWDEYVWEPSYEFVNPVGNMHTVCPDSTVTFIVSAYDSLTGCAGSDSITIIVDRSNVGMNEFALNGVQVTAFPNPVNDKLFIEIKGILQNQSVLILDQKGRIVYSGDLNATGITEINTSKLASGVYHCKVGAHAVFKLVK